MNAPTSENVELSDRVLKLERQNRRFKLMGLAVVSLGLIALVLGQAAAPVGGNARPRIVEAEEFLLKEKMQVLQELKN